MVRQQRQCSSEKAGAGKGAAAAAAAQPPWQCALQGLQRNCQQFGANLMQLQSRLCTSLAQLQAGGPLRAPAAAAPLASLSQAAVSPAAASWSGSGAGSGGGSSGGVVSKEEIGRATWTFLHTLAAQYPERPTRQQQRDARNLIDILTRMYPCGECARHFKEVVRQSPPAVASRHDFSVWMCEVHNVVNRRLGKPTFNCALVEARWAGMECGPEEGGDGRDACSLEVGRRRR